jgi:UDP-galactopyranose mutase
LRFESEIAEGDYQGASVVNYTEEDVPFTRILEHRHFDASCCSKLTVITREFPAPYERGGEAYYPVRDGESVRRFDRYKELAARSGIILGGRLATYQYYDMHHVAAQAITLSERVA